MTIKPLVSKPITRREFTRILAGAVVAASLAAGSARAGVDRPGALVDEFHGQLIPLIGAGRGRSNINPRLQDAVKQHFHMPLIARLVVGDAWRATENATKRRLVAAILDLNVATYLNQLGNDRLIRHAVNAVRPSGEHAAQVDATLVTSNGSLELTYVTRQIKGRWWIVDVLLDGKFSELERRRAEYRALIRESGVEGLIDTLERKSAQLASVR